MLALAVYGLVVGVQVYICGEHTTVSSSYVAVCTCMVIACPFGLYGACRVTSDVDAEEAATSAKKTQKGASDETVSNRDNDDGHSAAGHDLMAGFFVATMFGVMLWLILAIEAFQLADQAMVHDCSHQDALMATLGLLGIFSAVLLCVGSYYVGRIVSGYYLARTIVRLLNIALMVLGAGMYLFAASLVNQIICLSDGYVGYSRAAHPDDEDSQHSGLEESMASLIMLGLIALSGYSLSMVSAMGHFAATRLSRSLLQRHARALAIWMLLSFVFTVATMFVGAGAFVSAHCEDILTGFSMEWFQDELQCPKYVGAGETWNGSGWTPSSIGPSEMPSCVKSFNRFAWEVNPVQRVGGGEVNHFGCINKACCRRLVQRVNSWEWSIALTLVMIFVCAFSTIWMDYRLMVKTARTESGLKSKEIKMLWAARVSFALLALLVPMVVFDRDCSAVAVSEALTGNFASDVGSNSAFGDLPPSCYNNVLDGWETDIDCGGRCSTKCVLNEACGESSDCAEPMACIPTVPFDVGSGCFDERCLYRQIERASGRCGFSGPEVTCFDGQMGQQETCIDGGGPQCRELGRRCTAECVVDDDCHQHTAQLRCEQYRCVTCAGGTKDGGETDIDCGGPTCLPCDDGLRCLAHHDCRSEVCHSSTGRCVSYTNNVKDGSETGVDCGGLAPRRCQLGSECVVDSDCQSGNCAQSLCIEPDPAEQCWSGVQDGLETCTDAGGPICRSFGLACGDGEGCSDSSDCSTGLHCYEGACFSCSNGIVDGDESDVDCGFTCGICADGRACSTDGQCRHNSYCFFGGSISSGMCASTYNSRQDADESCIDGGGQAALLFNKVCPVGDTCNADYDCITGNCGDQGRCIADDVGLACLDGVQNGWETDTDCGGRSCRSVGRLCSSQTSVQCSTNADCLSACHGIDCPCINGRCGAPQQCLVNEDCASGTCHYGYCRSCANGFFDGSETDVDCGGSCAGCGEGRNCYEASDCVSGMCEIDRVSGRPWKMCVSCFNGVQDGSELDIDCGGNCVRRCPMGSHCTEPSDCVTEACDSTMHMCVRPTANPGDCSNGLRESTEADVDCGGTCRQSQPLCSLGSMCVANDDCDSYQCSTMRRCISCSDGVLNGAETDIDCGGDVCDVCADAQRCDADSDCSSQNCAGGGEGHRACSSCLNGIRDGLEADVDCGAVCPTQCLDDRRCYTDDDCISMHCNSNGLCTRVDPASTCSDGFQREHETCIDGGGPQCNALGLHCGHGAACDVDDDCQSGHCDADGVCVSCADEQRNGDETDIDCGGSRCGQCADGNSCMLPTDCVNQACWFRNGASTSGTCYSHSNGIRDGDETCPDGGGPNSGTACANGEDCSVDSDCISSKCAPTCTESASESIDADLGACAAVSELDDAIACQAVMGSIRTTTAVCTYSGPYNKVCQMQHPEITCNDNVQGQLETDIDCGGDACRSRGGTCLPGQQCSLDADCEIGSICSPVESGSQLCVSLGCVNGIVSGDEADVDCGGGCDPCMPGQACRTDADCLAAHACLQVPADNSTICAQVLPIVFSPVRCGETAAGTIGVCPANPAMECEDTCEPDKSCPVGCADAPTTAMTKFEVSSRDVLMHTILVEASEPYGAEGRGLSCDITVKLYATAGLTITFPAERSRANNDLGFSITCQARTSVIVNAHNDITLSGPASCVAALLDAYELDTTCSTLWSDDDSVDAVVTATLLGTGSFCAMPDAGVEVEFAVRIVGRPQLEHRGTLTAAASSAGLRSQYAISGIQLSGQDRVCSDYLESLTNCERGCCDAIPAVNIYGRPASCTLLLSFGFLCSTTTYIGSELVDVGEQCPDTCNLCGSLPEAPAVASVSQDYPTAGVFVLDVPFTATSSAASSLGTLTTHVQDGTTAQMMASGFMATTITTPLQDGMMQVGTIPLASYGSRRGSIEGRCVASSSWGSAYALRGEGLGLARLRAGHLVYPADTEVVAQVDVDLQSGGAFSFDDQAAGTYTVECIGSDGTGLDGRRGAERLVVVEGDAAPSEFPQVILMPGTPQASPSAITIVISWDEYGDAKDTLVDAHATCTLSLPPYFISSAALASMLNRLSLAVAATGDGSLCHIFYGAELCGGAMYLLDGPVSPGGAPWLPSDWNTDGLRAEVLQIDSVIGTM